LLERGQRQVESILESPQVNWYDTPSLSNTQPVPVVDKQSGVYSEIIAEIDKLQSRPIRADELAGMLLRLQGHYWVAGMPERLIELTNEDYIRLIMPKSYNLNAVQMAYDAYLLNPANKFFPKIGEIEDLIKSCQNKIKYRLLRLNKLKENAE